MTIYDRSKWPAEDHNPLIILFESEADWFSNSEVLAALGYGDTKRSLISQWPTLAEQLGEGETAIAERGLMVADNRRQPRGGGLERYYSRKAVALIAMRAQTVNAAAFCDWLAAETAADVRLSDLL